MLSIKKEKIVYGVVLEMNTKQKYLCFADNKKKKLLKSLPPVVPITTIKKWTRQG